MNEEQRQRYFALRDQGRSHEEALGIIFGRAGLTGKVSDVARGGLTGLAQLLPGAAGGLGYAARKAGEATGLESVERAGRAVQEFSTEAAERARRYYDPRGPAGRAGEIGGRIAGEVALAVPTIGLSAAGLARFAPSVASRLSQGSRVSRALYGVATEAPLTAVQAARTASEGGNVPLDIALNLAGSSVGGLLTKPRQVATRAVPEVAEQAARETVEEVAEETPTITLREAQERLARASEEAPAREIPEIRTAEPTVVEPQPRKPIDERELASRREAAQRSRRSIDERRELEERAEELAAQRRAAGLETAGPSGLEVVSPRNVIPESDVAARREIAEQARREAEILATRESVEGFVDDIVEEVVPAVRETVEEVPPEPSRIIPAGFRTRTPEQEEVFARLRREGQEAAEAPRLRREAQEDLRRRAQEQFERVRDSDVADRLRQSRLMIEGAEQQRAAMEGLEQAAEVGRREAQARAAGERGLDLYTFPGPLGQALRSQAGQSVAGGALGASLGAGLTPEEGDPVGGALVGGVLGLLTPIVGRGAVRSITSRAKTPRSAEQAAEQAAEAASARRPAQRAEDALEGVRRQEPLQGPVDPDLYYRAGRYGVSEEAAQGLRKSVEDVVREYGVPMRDPDTGRLLEPQRWQEAEKAAEAVLADYGFSPAALARRTAEGERISGIEVLAMDKEVTRLMEQQNAIYKRMQNITDEDEVRLLQLQSDRIKDDIDALLYANLNQRTFAGRDLNLLAKQAFTTNDPAVWASRIRELVERPLNDFELAKIQRLAEDDNIDGLVKFAAESRKSTLGEKFIAWFKSGLLTQPSTHFANLGGNLGMLGLEEVKQLPAVVVDNVLSGLTGARTKALVKPSLDGAKKGAQEFMKALRGEPSSLQNLTKWDLVREVNFDNVLANVYTKGVFRLLDAEDRLFRGVAFVRSLEEQAKVAGLNAGYRGDDLARFIAETVARPSDTMVARAMGASEYAVFQNDSGIARLAMQTRNMIQNTAMKNMEPGSVPYQIMDVIAHVLFPFAKTPGNLASVSLEYSPIGVARGAQKLAKVIASAPRTIEQRQTLAALEAAGSTGTRALAESVAASDRLQKEAAEVLARGGIGTVGLLAGWLAYKNGIATGFYPTDERERNEWRATGKQPGSVKIDGSWVNVSRLAPAGNLIMMGAEMAKLSEMDEASIASRLTSTLSVPIRAVTELPMVSGLSDVMEALKTAGTPEAAEAFGRLGGRSVSGVLPASALLRGLAYGTDPYVRETRGEGVFDSVRRQAQSQFPGVSQSLPRRVTQTGEFVMRPGESTAGRVFRSTSDPFRITPDVTEEDPVLREIDRINIALPRLNRRRGETDEAFEQRSIMSGRATKAVLDAVFRSPQYQAISALPTEGIRAVAGALGFEVGQLSDEELAARVQRYIAETAASRARSAVSGAIPDPMGGSIGGFMRSLERR